MTRSDPAGLDYWTSFRTTRNGILLPGYTFTAYLVVTAPDLSGGMKGYPMVTESVNRSYNFDSVPASTSPAQDLVIRDALDTHVITDSMQAYGLVRDALLGPNGESFNPVNPFTGNITNNQGDWIGWEDPFTGNVYNSEGKWAGWDPNYDSVVVVGSPVNQNEQTRREGLARLQKLSNPYWGYLPTTHTTNFAGGIATPGGYRGGSWGTPTPVAPIQGSIFGPGNFYGGLDPTAAFGSGASSAGAIHVNAIP